MDDHQEYSVADQEEFARSTRLDDDELTAILSIIMDGQIAGFARTMAIRLGYRDGRNYLSTLLNAAIVKTMEEVNWSSDQIIPTRYVEPEPDPQLWLDLEDDIPF